MRTLAMLTLCLLPATAPAQQRPNWSGAFTAAQAGGGQQLYREECVRCHGATMAGGDGAPELSGAAFLARWAGKTPADLLDRTRRTMPTDNPGGLDAIASTKTSWPIILSANGYRRALRTRWPWQ